MICGTLGLGLAFVTAGAGAEFVAGAAFVLTKTVKGGSAGIGIGASASWAGSRGAITSARATA